MIMTTAILYSVVMEATSFRIIKHPVLGGQKPVIKVTIYLDDLPIPALQGEPIAAALYAAGVRITRYSPRRKEPRGPFCMIGRCTECCMTVDGVQNVRTCRTPVREGMRVETPGGGKK
jgi:predicted molibdopterin-dependent oxidoreductase YjgC